MWKSEAPHNHNKHDNYDDHSSSSHLFDSRYDYFSGSNLPPSSQLFLQALGLPILHPFCTQLTTRRLFDNETLAVPGNTTVASTSAAASPPPLGPLLPGSVHASVMDALITWCWMWIPPWIAFIDLWFRLLSGIFAPLGVVYLVWMEYQALKQRYMLRMTTNNHTSTIATASTESNEKEDAAKQHEAIKENMDPGNEMDREREDNQVTATNTTKGNDDYPFGGFSSFLRMFTTLATTCIGSLIIMTDSMYVMEYGPQYGVSLFVAALLLSMRVIHQYGRLCHNNNNVGAISQRHTAVAGWVMVGCILVLAGLIVWDPATRTIRLGQAEEVRIQISPGLYYSPNNAMVQRIVQHWPVSLRTYDNDETLLLVPPTLFNIARRKNSPNDTIKEGSNRDNDNNQQHLEQRLYPTPWMYTGDARTGLPYVLNRIPELDWTRVFLTVHDGEVLALDITFPSTGYNASNPLYMILHGANGGTDAEYVVDLAWRRTREANATVVVMVSRGLMDVPLRGWDIYDASRWSDAHETALALRRAAELTADVLATTSQVEISSDRLLRLLFAAQRRHGRRFRRHRRDPVILAGVGYSMGAIVLNNYVASAGRQCALDAAFSISGAMECRAEQYFMRPQRLWQPMIAHHIRAQQHLAKFGQRIQARLGVPGTIAMMRVTSVVDLDQYVTTDYYRDKYHGNVSEYYTAASALGDLSLDELHHHAPPLSSLAHTKIANVSIPLCVLHAFDDPISTWRTIVANDGLMHPERLVQVGQGNLVLLLTATGGHVGWPLGWLPTRHNWKFMSDAAGSFVDAVAQAKREHQ